MAATIRGEAVIFNVRLLTTRNRTMNGAIRAASEDALMDAVGEDGFFPNSRTIAMPTNSLPVGGDAEGYCPVCGLWREIREGNLRVITGGDPTGCHPCRLWLEGLI